jgi:beta-galactosidase
MKDEYNALLPSRQPGALAELAGVEVEDYYVLDELVPLEGNLLSGTSKQWAERLKVLDSNMTIPMARYSKSNGWLDGQVAMAVHSFGRGMVYTVGAYLDDPAQQKLINHILQIAGIRVLETPEGVEISQRVDPNDRVIYFVINHTAEARVLTLPWSGFDHLTGRDVRELQLEPYGAAIVTRSDQETA